MLKEVKIEVTNLCDRLCKHCSCNAINSIENCQVLSIHTVRKIIEEAKKMGAESIAFTGGEPILWGYLSTAIQYAKEKGLYTKLYTMCCLNGINLTLLEGLVRDGLDEINYSTTMELTQSQDASTYNLGEFFRKLKERVAVKVNFHHVITKETLDTAEAVVVLLNGINNLNTNPKLNGKVGFLRFVPHGRGTNELVLTKEQLQYFKQLVIRLRDQYGNEFIKIGSPFNILGLTHTPCTAGDETLIIGIDGKVYPCDAMKNINYGHNMGNIYKLSLEEIYNLPYMQLIRKIKDEAGKKCSKCDNYSLCHSGCLGQKILHSFEASKQYTFAEYQSMATRVLGNSFQDETWLLATSVELPEVRDDVIGDLAVAYIKRNIYTDDNIRQKILSNFGNIIWHIVAPILTYYDVSIDEVISELFHSHHFEALKAIDEKTIERCAKQPDPYCLKEKDMDKHKVASLDEIACTLPMVFNFNALLNDLAENIDLLIDHNIPSDLSKDIDISDYDVEEGLDELANNRRVTIEAAGEIILGIAAISNGYLQTFLESILKGNIETLKAKNPNAFKKEGPVKYKKRT